MNVSVIIEARMNSKRLPGKVLKKVLNRPLLELMIERVKRASWINDVIISTTINNIDDQIVNLAKNINVNYYRGSEDDVLNRVLETAKKYNVDLIVEIPGDCPLIDPRYIDYCIQLYMENDVDYVSSILGNTFPKGTEVQVFSTETLKDVSKRTNEPEDHEHVSLYIYKNPEIYSLLPVKLEDNIKHKNLSLTLDTEDDYFLIKNIYETLYPSNPDFGLSDIVSLF